MFIFGWEGKFEGAKLEVAPEMGGAKEEDIGAVVVSRGRPDGTSYTTPDEATATEDGGRVDGWEAPFCWLGR